jgi:hypothetical protein
MEAWRLVQHLAQGAGEFSAFVVHWQESDNLRPEQRLISHKWQTGSSR